MVCFCLCVCLFDSMLGLYVSVLQKTFLKGLILAGKDQFARGAFQPLASIYLLLCIHTQQIYTSIKLNVPTTRKTILEK